MNKTELKLDYTVCENNSGIPVIVVAAGSSSRMNGVNKQLAEIRDIPIIIRTLQAFENCNAVSNIILVVRDEDLFQIQFLCEKYMINKLTDIVCGGKNRQESVLKGFARLDKNCEKVLIHDGARPFVTDEIICSVAKALDEFSAAACGIKVKDTVKQIDSDGLVLKTVPRENLVAVQTPQGVRVADYLKATEKADISLFTDDTSIMESAGFKVCITEGSYRNIKITTKEDLLLAETFLGGTEE